MSLTEQNNAKYKRRARRIMAAVLAILFLPLLLPAASSLSEQEPAKITVPPIKPQVPKANRNVPGRVFLERANTLHKQTSDSFMILTGDVMFSRGAMLMYCDSAHYFPDTESLNAFGNVHMEQGDTLFVYADELNYNGLEQIAILYGAPVRMINRDVMLRTDQFIYDLYHDYGYYNVGGELTDKQNKLTSVEGEYVPSTKEANFYTEVNLTSVRPTGDTIYIYSDTLYYNTNTHIAELYSPSEIINKTDTIFTNYGVYNTDTEIADLYQRSIVRMGRGTTLQADTLFYDRATGYGEGMGNMVLTDSARQTQLIGDYGYYNELIDSAFVTGRALAKEYSQGDTLYLHAKYIYAFAQYDTINHEADTIANTAAYQSIDTTHVMIAHPRVRFYRSDMQGVCDSMRFQQKDSTLFMLRHPIVWSEDRQIFGHTIQLHLNDSTIDRATLPYFGFSAQQVEGDFYNQLSGKEMIAYFEGGEMRRLDVNGNVEAIMLPMENDSTYNKIVNAESSYLTADFEKQNLLRMKLWPETSGTVTPLYLAKKSLFFLSKFKWYTGIRPTSPEDVFIIPPEMEALMQEPEEGGPTSKKATKKSL